ncbi:MAG TPA: hypothetical protein VGQ93_12345 [Lysobacter sp.]|jgi:hypothetical protein|nr:hypothetical protein [Lysobacter sp.]
MRAFSIVVTLLLLLAPAIAAAERPYVAIEQKLSPEQMQATGLNQLSAEQLALLNQLLREEHTAVAAEVKAAERERKKNEDTAPIASALKGEFRGWKNGTVFELANGQRWRVLDNEFYTTKMLTNPTVTVKPGLFGSWYMQVEGVGVQVKVKRVDSE